MTMSTQFDGNDTIYSRDVIDRIDELGKIIEEEELFEVRRNSDGQLLGTFKDDDDAEQFIQDEDYVRERVRIVENPSEVDDDELDELQQFDSDGRASIEGWTSGVTVTRGYVVDEDYARRWARDRGYRRVDSPIDDFVDWERVAEYILEGEDYATLNGDEYYAI